MASEKLDGTCVYIQNFRDDPWLWARHDRKPNKVADRRFRKFQGQHSAWEVGGRVGPEPLFKWNLQEDLRNVPVCWIPAAGVALEGECPTPDEQGHIPGWVPVDPQGRQHCWHLTAVDIQAGAVLVLQEAPAGGEVELEIALRPMTDFIDCTMELIGTHVNANPYKLGTKEDPIHVLVRHGSLKCQPSPPQDYQALQDWLTDTSEGMVEGVVWHCSNGHMYKAHRHHFGLKWPIEVTQLAMRSVRISVDLAPFEDNYIENTLMHKLSKLHEKTFPSIMQITFPQD